MGGSSNLYLSTISVAVAIVNAYASEWFAFLTRAFHTVTVSLSCQ